MPERPRQAAKRHIKKLTGKGGWNLKLIFAFLSNGALTQSLHCRRAGSPLQASGALSCHLLVTASMRPLNLSPSLVFPSQSRHFVACLGPPAPVPLAGTWPGGATATVLDSKAQEQVVPKEACGRGRKVQGSQLSQGDQPAFHMVWEGGRNEDRARPLAR